MNDVVSRWSVPGSLLIAGEYIVTEQGGPGLALAAARRATLSVTRSKKPLLEGSGPPATERWTPASGNNGSLMFAVYEECRISESADTDLSVKLSVDTSKFYNSMGGKLGYGSSAAAAVLFTRGLLSTDDVDAVSSRALNAHRRWQQGRGSGYDILSSINGGAGFFLGGIIPEWSPLSWPSQLKFWLIRGPAAVNSSIAVKKYQQWLNNLKMEWDSVPLLSGIRNEMLFIQKALNRSSEPEPSTILETINRMAEYGCQLGHAIDVPAMPVLPDGFSKHSTPWYRPGSAAAKCLGAGDEIILLAALPDGLAESEMRDLEALISEGNACELKIDPAGLISETIG